MQRWQNAIFPIFFLSIKLLTFQLIGNRAIAQIIPDNTTNSQVSSGCTRCTIEGGLRSSQGTNLFHSFEHFSIPAGGEAFFNIQPGVRNIFTRVTGSHVSRINGSIRTSSQANLFLMNPNGILFGRGASLNIGGSFVATTANAITFEDNTRFSAINSQALPLLTVNVPIGLQFGATLGAIHIRNTELAAAAGRTLAIAGGNVILSQGTLSAIQGRIEVGSVGSNEQISLTTIGSQGWQFEYPQVSNFQAIRLLNNSTISSRINDRLTSETPIGTIQVRGDRICLENSRIQLIADGNAQTGNVLVQATERIDLLGQPNRRLQSSGIFNEVRDSATGKDRQLTVETNRLALRDGAQIAANTFGSGQGAELQVTGGAIIDLLGSTENSTPSGLFSRVGDRTFGGVVTGRGGAMLVQSNRIILREGAQISTSTFSQGNAGNLTVRAGVIEAIGTIPGTNSPTGVFASVGDVPGATGNGGSLTIGTRSTGRLIVRDGAQISTTAQNIGRGGTLTINAGSILLSGTTPQAQLRGEGRSGLLVSAEPAISREAVTTADAGTLNLTAGELILEQGAFISADNFGRGAGATVNLNVDRLVLRNGGQIGAGSLIEVAPINPDDNVRGPGGAIDITANEVSISGATLLNQQTVNSQIFTLAEGTGQAGDIHLRSSNLTLTDQGAISATTRSTNGGNITLTIHNLTLLRDNSRISTSAGTELAGGDGGRINIRSRFVAAGFNQNNDITANAFSGSGGSVTITAQGILGLIPRSRDELQRLLNSSDPATLNPEGLSSSDVTAISQLNPNLNGQVIFNAPNVDPSEGLIELPTDAIDASNLIANSCLTSGVQTVNSPSRFTTTGRSGLSPNPAELLRDERTFTRWIRLPPSDSSQNSSSTVESTIVPSTPSTPSIVPLVEAQGWILNAQGKISLIAQAPDNPSGTSPPNSVDCNDSNRRIN